MVEPSIIGAGMVRFGRYPETTAADLAAEASLAAITDAGLDLGEIGALYCGHVAQGMTFAQTVASTLGVAGIPAANFENACASSATAFHFACLSVMAGQYDAVLVCGAEKMARGLLPLTELMECDLEALLGMTIPSLSALHASRYAARFELCSDDLAAVVVMNRRNAAANPFAQYQATVSVDEVLRSPMISTPLTRLMCCPTSDGAAAVVVVGPAMARRHSHDAVRVLASHIEGGSPIGAAERANATARAARHAYERAGIGPQDIDLVEGLNYTAMAEILLYEDLGFCALGGGVAMLRNGETALDGRVAFSPGGGLIGRGHPLGATGVAQLVETTWQLRGFAGGRQVPNARVGLTHAAGGVITGIDDEAVVVVHVLGR
ncbi:MAG: thiolase family protein [Stellaceae bacterium]